MMAAATRARLARDHGRPAAQDAANSEPILAQPGDVSG
jgi:hypothetical protein